MSACKPEIAHPQNRPPSPRPPGYERTRDTFPNRTGVTFDPVAGAEAAADLTVSLLLNSQRAVRLDEYHARDNENPDFADVLRALEHAVWDSRSSAGVQYVVMNRALGLAADPAASEQVRSETIGWLKNLQSRLNDPYVNHQMEIFERDPKQLEASMPMEQSLLRLNMR